MGSCNQAEGDERRWIDAFPSSYVPGTSEAHIPMLLETPDIHQEWQRLVVEHQVSGKKAHDTRLVAAMRVHGVEGIVTYNGDDFRRYPGINVLHPRDLAQ